MKKQSWLYKCSGAWSPLWQLSSESKFEIVSLDYEANLKIMPPPPCVGVDVGKSDVTLCTFDSQDLSHFEKAVKALGFSGVGFVTPQPAKIYWPKGADTLDVAVLTRAEELFGRKPSKHKTAFVQELFAGKLSIVRR